MDGSKQEKQQGAVSSGSSSDVKETDAQEIKSPPPPKFQPNRRFWAILLTCAVIGLLSALENTVVTTALPHIATELELGENYVWVSNVFFLTGFVPNLLSRFPSKTSPETSAIWTRLTFPFSPELLFNPCLASWPTYSAEDGSPWSLLPFLPWAAASRVVPRMGPCSLPVVPSRASEPAASTLSST
jgi:hypothetical protein